MLNTTNKATCSPQTGRGERAYSPRQKRDTMITCPTCYSAAIAFDGYDGWFCMACRQRFDRRGAALPIYPLRPPDKEKEIEIELDNCIERA